MIFKAKLPGDVLIYQRVVFKIQVDLGAFQRWGTCLGCQHGLDLIFSTQQRELGRLLGSSNTYREHLNVSRKVSIAILQHIGHHLMDAYLKLLGKKIS